MRSRKGLTLLDERLFLFPALPDIARRFGLMAYAAVTLAVAALGEALALDWGYLRVVGVSATAGGAIILLLSTTSYWSPWRVLWRWFPALNGLLFPDLNGVWVGKTSSNWPVIKAMRDAAASNQAADLAVIERTGLQDDVMVVEIKASLIKLVVVGFLSSTQGRSETTSASVSRSPQTGDIRLSYFFGQTTPNPALTDQDRHSGAAELVLEHGDFSSASGEYWTRRSWRGGMNTAGHLELRKVTDRYDASKKKLRDYADDARAT